MRCMNKLHVTYIQQLIIPLWIWFRINFALFLFTLFLLLFRFLFPFLSLHNCFCFGVKTESIYIRMDETCRVTAFFLLSNKIWIFFALKYEVVESYFSFWMHFLVFSFLFCEKEKIWNIRNISSTSAWQRIF